MTRKLGRLTAGSATVTLLAGMACTVGAGTAFAADKIYESGDIAYTCQYPLLGPGGLTGHGKAVGPDSIQNGTSATVHDLQVTATVPPEVAEVLYNTAGVDGVRGVADADVGISGGTLDSPTATNVRVDDQRYGGKGAFPVQAHQDAGTFVPTATAGPAPGPLTISLGNTITVRVAFHFLHATPEWQDQPAFTCTQNAGQDPTLGSAPIT